MAKALESLSGPDMAAFKAALGNMNYMVPIAAGEISSPVEYLELSLPTGYSFFLIQALLKTGAADILVAVLSDNDGASYHGDFGEWTGYAVIGHKVFNGITDGVVGVVDYAANAHAQLMSTSAPNDDAALSIFIRPGAVSQNAMVVSNSDFLAGATVHSAKLTAVLTAATGRMNKIKIGAEGNFGGWNDPAVTFTGTYQLFGAPTP